jgi:hypothetical protein
MRRTRTANQSSLFSSSFTATAKKNSEPSEVNFEEAHEHSVEPVVNAMPHSLPSVPVPLVQQPSQSQSQSLNLNSQSNQFLHTTAVVTVVQTILELPFRDLVGQPKCLQT